MLPGSWEKLTGTLANSESSGSSKVTLNVPVWAAPRLTGLPVLIVSEMTVPNSSVTVMATVVGWPPLSANVSTSSCPRATCAVYGVLRLTRMDPESSGVIRPMP